jgi:hypothetical protein
MLSGENDNKRKFNVTLKYSHAKNYRNGIINHLVRQPKRETSDSENKTVGQTTVFYLKHN